MAHDSTIKTKLEMMGGVSENFTNYTQRILDLLGRDATGLVTKK